MESSHLILGIDTGGTFTDAVVVDPAGQRIPKATKALTTHADLTRGIEQAIRQLELSPGEVLATVVSTTLATNAVVEGQTRPVALALIGYDPALMEQFRLDRNIFATVTAHFPGGHDVFGQARPGFDPDAVARWARSCWPAVEAFAVSAYFSPLDPHCETEAAAAIQAAIRQRLSAPIVLGSQLTASLDAVKRATTASLNASLLPIALEFMQAVSQAATPFTRGLLLSCRGDGTLMRLQTAVARPIDTVASGPAASALGAAFLAHRSTALVVDVGGTTSDITLVVDGSPRLSPEGATVGGYPTAVPAIEVETLGLGGDSRVHLASPTLADSVMTSAVVASPAPTGPGATGLWGRPDEPLAIGPDRVIPLARLAARHPRVLSELKALVAKPSLSPDDAAYLEYWFLTGDITGESRSTGLLTSAERELIDVLSSGPLSTPDLLARLRVPGLQLVPWEGLLRRGLLGRAGITPTDALHITGDYEPWDKEASLLAARALGSIIGRPPEEIPQLILTIAARILARTIVRYLTPPGSASGGNASGWVGGEWFLEGALRPQDRRCWPLQPALSLQVPIIAVGGAGPALLPQVAELYHTDCVVPPHHRMASAVGAAVGRLVARCEGRVYPAGPGGGSVVSINGNQATFWDEQEALAYARTAAIQAARRQAAREELPESGPVEVLLLPEGSGHRVVATLQVDLDQAGTGYRASSPR